MSQQLKPTLTRSDDELRGLFFKLHDVDDVAAILEIPTRQLTHVLWRSPAAARYSVFRIRKRRGGERLISAPGRSHKILQRKLLQVLSVVYRARESVHGFRAGRSIVTNASAHVKQRFVLNVDLRDYFATVNFGRVRGMFMAKPYGLGERAATALAQLCCSQGSLPQGAPTSPIVANMVTAKLDSDLQRLARRYGCHYTRYADDLTLSTSRPSFPVELAALVGTGSAAAVGPALREVIEVANGFSINDKKVRLQARSVRQEVTGLTVNRRANIRRIYLNRTRAMLHAWEKHGEKAALAEFLAKFDTKHRPHPTGEQLFRRVVAGRVAFLKQVLGENHAQYRRLRTWLGRLRNEPSELVVGGIAVGFDVFICHATEDKSSVVRPLAKALQEAGLRVWLDESEIAWGDSITQKIGLGLSKSSFVLVVLSEAFLAKNWPQKEMNAALAREVSAGVTSVLPLLVGGKQSHARILQAYPLVRDKLFMEWDPGDVGRIVSSLKGLVARTVQGK